jgi:multiple sugar transport system ATP-binding protein
MLGIRPEHMKRAAGAALREGHVRLPVKIELIQPTGSRTYITFSLARTPIIAEVSSHDVERPGEEIDLDLDMNRAILIDPDSGRVIGADGHRSTTA